MLLKTTTFSVAAFLASIVAARDGKEFNGKKYLSQTAQQKSDQIWAKVIEDQTSGSWHFAQQLLVPQDPVFDTEGDEMPCHWGYCRKKTIHSIGNVSKITWQNTGNHPYTGMFLGAEHGYIRMSVAAPPAPDSPNLRPSFGLKLLRDGMDSANFVALFSVDGQPTMNWFANDFSNHIPALEEAFLRPLFNKFSQTSEYVQTVGLSEMASFRMDGTVEDAPVFPWKLRFEPTGQINFPDTVENGYKDFKDDLASISEGSTLYQVYAMDKPVELGGTESVIGIVVSKSPMKPSNWGDNHLYFRHQKMEDDLAIHPEWEPYTPKWNGLFGRDNDPGRPTSLAQIDDASCPFAYLLDYLQ